MPRLHLDLDLDSRLLAYAAGSWNARRAVYCLQQLVSLLPRYADNVDWMDGEGADELQLGWGRVADVVAAATGLPVSVDALRDLGMVGTNDLIELAHDDDELRLVGSAALRRVELPADKDGIGVCLRRAVEHDITAKPLLDRLQDEIRSADSALVGIAAELDHIPSDFPCWDGRPLFLAEQASLLRYLARNAAAELVADLLMDQPIGEYLLRASGVLAYSSLLGELVLQVDHVPLSMLSKPVSVICHEVGNCVLDALVSFDREADPLDLLVVAEVAVSKALSIDISEAFVPARRSMIERKIDELSSFILDVEGRGSHVAGVAPYEFPAL